MESDRSQSLERSCCGHPGVVYRRSFAQYNLSELEWGHEGIVALRLGVRATCLHFELHRFWRPPVPAPGFFEAIVMRQGEQQFVLGRAIGMVATVVLSRQRWLKGPARLW